VYLSRTALQIFLQSYDAVVLSDGSFEYARSLLEEIVSPQVSLLGLLAGGL
jgi:hypothetical protein